MKLYRGELFYFTGLSVKGEPQWVYYEEGALCVDEGRILATGDYASMKSKYPNPQEVDYRGYLLMPGFVDAHIHFVQSEMIGMSAPQLLDWLTDYTFPLEGRFTDMGHCQRIANVFVKELFRNGTTACAAFGSIHADSVDALFGVAAKYQMCMIAGKAHSNRYAPDSLCEKPDEGAEDARRLIEKWHGNKRLHYAITPRFSVSCTEEELKICGALHEEFPDTYIQTHLSENRSEVETVMELYPGAKDYLHTYEEYGLLTDRTLFAHGIYLSDSELKRIADSRAVVVHCPTSNSFLGSGIYDMARANSAGVLTVMGTDVGAGTSFSMFQTMGESYKVQQIKGYMMPVMETFYKATLGSASALHLEKEIGSLLPDQFADFIVVDYASTIPQRLRMDYLEKLGRLTIEQKLFGLQTMADDRAIKATFVAGNCVHEL